MGREEKSREDDRILTESDMSKKMVILIGCLEVAKRIVTQLKTPTKTPKRKKQNLSKHVTGSSGRFSSLWKSIATESSGLEVMIMLTPNIQDYVQESIK